MSEHRQSAIGECARRRDTSSTRLGFALVLLVGIASVASLLFLTSTSSTGYVTVHLPTANTCKHVSCPGHELAEPVLDSRGYVQYHDLGNPICICPRR